MSIEPGYFWARPKGGLDEEWEIVLRSSDVDEFEGFWWFIGGDEPIVSDEVFLEHYELGPRAVFPVSYIPEDV